MSIGEVAELIARANEARRHAMALVKLARAQRDKHRGEDLPPLAETAQEYEAKSESYHEATRHWFTKRGIPPPV